MTDYKCGHSQDLLILDDNPLSMVAYLTWSETVGREGTKELCFECWSKQHTSFSQDQSKGEKNGNP